MFISVARSLRLKHAQLLLMAPQDQVREVFDHVCLSEIIPIDRAQHTPGLLEEDLPRNGQRHATGRPVEQPRADLLLEQRNLVRDRGLREIARIGGLGEMTQLRNARERTQQSELHSRDRSRTSTDFIGRMLRTALLLGS